MITKKDIPFDLLQTIEPIAQANLDIIQLKKDTESYYNFIEIDHNSSNCFKIYLNGSKKIGNFAGGNYALEWKPRNTNINKPGLVQLDLKKVKESFQNWVKMIRDFNETPSVHDDNFVKQYAEFYYNEFKIVDQDSDISPFDPNQQDLIEVYLLSLSNVIEKSDNKLSNTIKIELLNDIQEIQSSLPTTTKNQVMKGVTKVFGKLYKTSKKLAKEIVTEARKHLIKSLIELGIEYGPKLLEIISKQ